MRSARLIAMSAALLCSAALAVDDATDATAPDFVLKSTTGPNLRLSEYRGEVVMLAFWASWCGQCRSQLQSFDELYASYADVGFEVLAVSLDSQMSQSRDTAESLGLKFPVLFDAGGDVGEQYGVDDLPLVVLIDRDGRVRDVVEGAERGNTDRIAEQLRGLLRE
jgi:peroxiredoxin